MEFPVMEKLKEVFLGGFQEKVAGHAPFMLLFHFSLLAAL